VPAAAPAVAAAPSTYERRVNDAAALGADDADRAVRTLQQLAADQPDRPEAYEALATIRLRQGDLRQATAMIDSAMRNGGKATFTVVHDHSKGNFEKDPKASCVGELVFTSTDVRFDGVGAGDSHHFEATWAEVIEAGSNKFFGSGIGGFHVAMNPDGKYKNINLAPKSKDKAEAKMIIDLLNASARGKTERGGK